VWYCEIGPILIVDMEVNPNKKRVTPIIVWGLSNIWQRMSGGCFEGYVVNKCGSYDVPRSGYKYIHCDLINCEGYMIMTLTIESYFATSFYLCLNIGGFVHITNFGVTFHNKFERGDWGLVIRVGVSTINKYIDPFHMLLHFVPTRTIHEFVQNKNLEDLGTIKVFVISIYGRSAKSISLLY